MHVLIVEEEIPLANEVRKYLGKEGFSCDEAHTGRIASDKLFSNDYDLMAVMRRKLRYFKLFDPE